MNKILKAPGMAILYGFLTWLALFIVGIVIYPIHDSNRPLFESIMPVVLTITVLFFSILYFKKADFDYFKDGVIAGLIWIIISLIIDLILFIPESPMQMTIVDYIMDIGLTYLIILVIPIGIGYLIENK